MIEYIKNVPEKYSDIEKRSENDVSTEATVDQLIQMVKIQLNHQICNRKDMKILKIEI